MEKVTHFDAKNVKFKDLLLIDQKEQFLTACFVDGENPVDKEARVALAAAIGVILKHVGEQALAGEKIDYTYTSEVVMQAIRQIRAQGIDAPYIAHLASLTPDSGDTPDLFPEIEKQPQKLEALSMNEANIISNFTALQRFPAPAYNRPDSVKIPTANLARNIHKTDTTAPNYSPATYAYPVDKKPHEHFVYMELIDKLAEQYPIAPIDKSILIALGNLYPERIAAGKKGFLGGAIITADDIIRLYRGLDATSNITEAEVIEIQKRIEYLSKLQVSFDFTQHFAYNNVGDEVQLSIPDEKKRKLPKSQESKIPDKLKSKYEGGTVVRFSYKGNMIDLKIIEVEYASGRIERAYELLTPPIVYDYAEKVKQIQKVETKLLDLRKRANSGRDTDVIKLYLIEQINAMKSDKTNRSTRIKLDTMFEDLRIPINSRQQKQKKVEAIKRILSHFAETTDTKGKPFIVGYKEVIGRRRALIGYDIELY